MDAKDRGREDLARWQASQPSDLYADDSAAKALTDHHGLQAWAEAFHHAGRVVAGPLDEAVRENNLHGNLPELNCWDGIGRPTNQVRHHPTWWDAGRLIYGTGIMAAYATEPAPHRAILTLFYLTGQAGEAGHNCPLACAAGAIRSLQALGTTDQRSRYLTRLLDPDFDTNFTASQFLTEVQGGSDVGANAVRAVSETGELGAGSAWAIHGEKWFCSNVDADVFVMTARPEGAQPGTRGLGLFLVPRICPDGSLNKFTIRRLKDKIGTRSMASGELDFNGAYAEALGPVDEGFKHVMSLVITTSRLYNAAGCAAHSRRAWVIASTYAQHRQAFGQPIGRFAQVAETLAQMRADAEAAIATTLWLTGLLEQLEAGTASEDEAAFFRVAVNLNKLVTAMQAHTVVNQGIEVLGGNGAIESFSILPRLLRDNVVYENWEGTHNVLRAQVLRDCTRLAIHEGFFTVLAAHLGTAPLEADQAELAAILAEPGDRSELRFRALCGRLCTHLSMAAMAQVPALADAAQMTARHLAPLPVDADYLALIDRLQR
jgi:alkylation response protein AidB-like acyl-CoA dehydrogenase